MECDGRARAEILSRLAPTATATATTAAAAATSTCGVECESRIASSHSNLDSLRSRRHICITTSTLHIMCTWSPTLTFSFALGDSRSLVMIHSVSS